MVKNFILDTNILIHCPDSILKFEEHNVYITHTTLEELDNLKTRPGETGFNARESIRYINQLRKNKNPLNGIPTPGGGKFYILTTDALDYEKLPDGWEKNKPDNKILLLALELKKKKKNVFLVSNDVSMQLKAEIMGISAQEYKNDRASVTDDLYTGRMEYELSTEDMEIFKKKGEVSVVSDKMQENQFIVLKSEIGDDLGVYKNGKIEKLKYRDNHPFGVTPRNVGQYFAQEALLSPADEVPMVILKGPAGTAKTYLSLATGLEQVVETDKYKRILICRPNVKFDEDIGYLKGDEMDKILPLIRPCLDNLEELISSKDKDETLEELQDKVCEFFDRGWIKAEALAYLRGRSITDTFIIIDESQNSSPNQMLGIITRAGVGSKICILGDVEQIDAPRLDAYNNGLTFASERMKGSKHVMQVTFTEEECTRSELSKEAAERLAK